ncbi:phosphatase [Clostridium polyendosporum]|uniref:Phosphatase n=1 Tax=Clostridium polyendosporum TaxID=69208 RepID=A0A919RZI2_9CLOT|nr:PHP domain-containing protein [Clostridium polyendosporum]GIM29196.1 phosphatase [Clostridium polyendosporum]
MDVIKADLHMHTRASDGTLTPEEVVDNIKQGDIKLFSVTDHDTIGSITKLKELAALEGIKFIPGVEISSIYKGELLHILAYNFDVNDEKLLKLIKNNEYLLQKKDDDSIKMLIKHGFELDYDEYLSYEHEPARGGWKTLNFLIDKGVCSGVEEYFGKVFTEERMLIFPKFPEPKVVIDTIKSARGIPVLAHPRYSKSQFDLYEMLDMFRNWDIEGVECYHPHHDNEITKRCVEYCENHGLLITGGSDYHGGLLSTRSLGKPEFYTYINLLDK